MKEPKPIPQVPAALCGSFEGAHLVATERIVGLFGAPIPANARLVAGEVDSVDGQRFLTVAGRSPLGVLVEVMVREKDWGKLVLVLDSPLALCHAARWLAGRLGLDPGVTAPEWRYNGSHWYLMCVGGKVAYFYDYENGPTKQTEYSWWLRVPGVNNMSPAEALAAACVAVGGAP